MRAKARMGSTKASRRFSKLASVSFGHAHASHPVAMEPPDTLEMRLALAKSPNSFSRMNAPTWKSIARKPPPDAAMPMPASNRLPSHWKLASFSALCAAEEEIASRSPIGAPPFVIVGRPHELGLCADWLCVRPRVSEIVGGQQLVLERREIPGPATTAEID